MTNLKIRIRKIARNIPFARWFYNNVIKKVKVDASIREYEKYIARKTDYSNLRINIIVPTLNSKYVFGGVSTALNLFYKLTEKLGCDSRIIVPGFDNDISHNLPKKYVVVNSNVDSSEPHQVVRYSMDEKGFAVGKNDYFITTLWVTAINSENVIKWQQQTYGGDLKPMLYLIQDYEPGFYPWSAQYALAEQTYHLDVPTYAIVNSFELKEFLDRNGYKFTKTFAFAPVLNSKLKEYLPSQNSKIKKQKTILVYGRPNTVRNAFTLVVESLKEFCKIMPNVEEWTFISAGEKHPNIRLKDKIVLKSVGKMSLEEYAKMMLSAYAGISLMISPHPSYPPLEMSTFGVKTITNSYANKNLTGFNDNIVSIDCLKPESIAEKLVEICSAYSIEALPSINEAYCNTDSFANIITELSNSIKQLENM